MQLQVHIKNDKTDCYVSLPRSFQRFTTQSFSSGNLCQVIQAVSTKSNKIFYFGCKGISEDNQIEIGIQFAKSLEIDQDDLLQISSISNCNQSNALTVYVQKWADYLIVQHMRDKFESSILNSLQIVFNGLNFPVFYSEGQFVTFTFKAEDYEGPIAISLNAEINILVEESQKPEVISQQLNLTVLIIQKEQFESYIEINTDLYHNYNLTKLHQITYVSDFPKQYKNFEKFANKQRKNTQNQNKNPKQAIVQFIDNNQINNEYCFISNYYAKFLGLRNGQIIVINTQEHDISKEAQVRKIKRNELLNQKIIFNLYAQQHLNKDAFIKLILSQIEKKNQTVFVSRVHSTQNHQYFLRIIQNINNEPDHLITILSITNETNEPKVIGEREKALLIKYFEENIKIYPLNSNIQKEVQFFKYSQFKVKQQEQDFNLFFQLFENQINSIRTILNFQKNSFCLLISKEQQANSTLIQYLKTKYDVLKLNLDKLNSKGSNEKLSTVKQYIKHIFWQTRQVKINDQLIIIKGVESIKSTDLIDFQQSFLIMISNILSKFLKNEIKQSVGVKLIVISPQKNYLNEHIEKIVSTDQIIEFQKPNLELRKSIYKQYFKHNLFSVNAEQLAQRSENFTFSEFNALSNREKYQYELNENIDNDWIIKQIEDLQDKHVHLNKKIPTFQEIGGLKAQKQMILDLFELPMKYEKLFAKSKIKLPKSVLIYGMPGCGKSYFSESICNELKINVVQVKGPELLDKYIGSSEQNVRNLFQKAQGLSPCIIFLDEIDSIVPVRTSSHSGVTDRVVNQFLCYLDGVEEEMKGVYIVATSSRPDLIDPALLRPGRIDKHIKIDLPNKEEIAEIFNIYKGPLQLDGITEEEIINQLSGLSQADVVAFIKEARIYLADQITNLDDFSIKKKNETQFQFNLNQDNFNKIKANLKSSLSKPQILFYNDIYLGFEKGGTKQMKSQKQAFQ